MFLKVPLCKELVKEEISPLASNVKRARLSRDICRVDTNFKKLLFAIKFFGWVGFIDQVLRILALLYFILLYN